MLDELILLWMLSFSVSPAVAQQVSIGIGFPHVSIGINLPLYPDLVPVPGYPVYYAPQVNSNYFFYDGMYWVYERDNWYASSWYNGPWGLVGPEFVPVFLLRIPVRYYRQPPAYFRGWQPDSPPRWGEHWGNEWERHHSGWDQWNRQAVPARPPLPIYQRQYAGDRYPRAEQQPAIQSQYYHYQPRDPVVRQQYEAQSRRSAPERVQRERTGERPDRGNGAEGAPRANAPPPREQIPRNQVPRQVNPPDQSRPPEQRQQREQRNAVPRQQPAPRESKPGQDKSRQGQGKARQGQGSDHGDREGDEGRGQGHGQ